MHVIVHDQLWNIIYDKITRKISEVIMKQLIYLVYANYINKRW